MFERYTEKARRVIFFARYEASQFGQQFIETEHLLLGLLREDKALTNRLLHLHSAVEPIRNEIAKHTTIREKISTSVDLPLSNESKRVLAYAAEEADRLGHKHIGSEHLFLGLLREEGCFARQILQERGVELEKVREELAKLPPQELRSPSRPSAQSMTGLFTDLTQKAAEGELEPAVERDLEVDSVIEILCRKERRNPILLGEHGAGKTTIVEALAQRLAEAKVPASLAETRVLAVSAEVLSAWAPGRERFQDLAQALGTVASAANLILFVDGLHAPPARGGSGFELAGVLRFAIQEAQVRCIAASNTEDYTAACAKYPGLDKLFRPLHVRPLDAAASMQVLRARKARLEKFHGVDFADEALQCAVERADSYLKDKLLPGKALELLDAAGTAVKLKQNEGPNEIAENRKRIAFIAERLAAAVTNHEFEKARFYSDEERKERQNLAELQLKYGMADAAPSKVTRDDVEQVISKWNVYPYSG